MTVLFFVVYAGFIGWTSLLIAPALYRLSGARIAERNPEWLRDRPVLAERAAAAGDLRLSTEGERAILALGEEQYEVGALGQLAALLFGGDTEEARAVPTRHGALGELLDSLFPLPLLWYGYNYV